MRQVDFEIPQQRKQGTVNCDMYIRAARRRAAQEELMQRERNIRRAIRRTEIAIRIIGGAWVAAVVAFVLSITQMAW